MNEENEKAPVERVVKLTCSCGCDFERDSSYLDKYEEYNVERPSVARFYKRKIDFCDKCLNEKMQNAFNILPNVLKPLAV